VSPLTSMGKRILTQMKEKYGKEEGEEVFYSSINKKKKGTKQWHREKNKRKK